MKKAPDAFRTISEVAEILETPAHVLRFWESKFYQIRPVKRAGGRRYYRPDDVMLINGIRLLLQDQGMTIRGVQRILQENGVKHVAALGGQLPMLDAETPNEISDVESAELAIIEGTATVLPTLDAADLPKIPQDQAPSPHTDDVEHPVSPDDASPERPQVAQAAPGRSAGDRPVADAPVGDTDPDPAPEADRMPPPVVDPVAASQPDAAQNPQGGAAQDESPAAPQPEFDALPDQPPSDMRVRAHPETAPPMDADSDSPARPGTSPTPPDKVDQPADNVAKQPAVTPPKADTRKAAPPAAAALWSQDDADLQEHADRVRIAQTLRTTPRGKLGHKRDPLERLSRRIDVLLERMSEASGAGRW